MLLPTGYAAEKLTPPECLHTSQALAAAAAVTEAQERQVAARQAAQSARAGQALVQESLGVMRVCACHKSTVLCSRLGWRRLLCVR